MGAQRADRVAAKAAEAGVDALLVSNLVNVRWLTGFTGSAALALVGAGADGARRFLTDFRYLTQSAEQLDDVWDREIAQDLLDALVARLPAQGGFKLGIEAGTMTVKTKAALEGKLHEGAELVATDALVEELRMVKDDSELEKIRAAAKLADAALEEVLARGLAGRTERDVALDLEVTMRRMGAEAASFPPIVAAGPYSALPHASPRDAQIPRGTLCVVDWGAQLDGYASDCTRTFHTGGKLDPRDAEIYEVVREAQQRSLDAVGPGAIARDVDTIARDIIGAAGHAEHFGHGLGHGVGAEVHEEPRLSQRSTATLAAGNVVTVEPGVYVPGAVGVRIEDLVAVTAAGREVLTSSPKDLRTVG